MTVLFRDATQADVEALVELINLAYRVEAFFVDGDRTDRSEVEGALRRGRFSVVDAPSGLGGCVYTEVRDGGIGYFGLLSVRPRAQGRGLGRRLLEHAEARLLEAGCQTIELTAVDLREPLLVWYHRLGYRVVGSLPFDADDRALRPCRFLVMRKRLTDSASPTSRVPR